MLKKQPEINKIMDNISEEMENMLKKQPEINKIMDNISEEMENIDKILEEFDLHQKRKIEIADIITKWAKEDDKTDAMDLEDYLEILKEVYNDHDKEINIHIEEERDEPTNDLSLKEKLNEAEEEGIKNTMGYLKLNCVEMVLGHQYGNFVELDVLNETNKDLIEEIKQM